jgi:ribose transport system permease protein
MISGLCASVSSLLYTAQIGTGSPTLGADLLLDVVGATVIGGTSLFGGRGSVFPGTILGAVLIQLITSGLIFVRVDIYLQAIVYAIIIFLIVLFDSFRTGQLTKIERRNIRRVGQGR